jgi:hypothetical protein
MRNTLKAALFISAFSPSLISVGVARLIYEAPFWDAVYYIIAGIVGTLLVFYIMSALKWYGESISFVAKKIESHDALLLGVTATYILPFFARAQDITLSIIVALCAVFFLVFLFTDVCVPSPLMRIFGFRFYKAEAANGMVYTLITDRDINDPGDVKAVKRLSSSMLLEVRR